MLCLHCGKRLSLLRRLTDQEFCSDKHRQSYLEEQEALGLARLIECKQQAQRASQRRGKPTPAATSSPGGIPPLAERFFERPPSPQSLEVPYFGAGAPLAPSPAVALPQADPRLYRCGVPAAPLRLPAPELAPALMLPPAKLERGPIAPRLPDPPGALGVTPPAPQERLMTLSCQPAPGETLSLAKVLPEPVDTSAAPMWRGWLSSRLRTTGLESVCPPGFQVPAPGFAITWASPGPVAVSPGGSATVAQPVVLQAPLRLPVLAVEAEPVLRQAHLAEERGAAATSPHNPRGVDPTRLAGELRAVLPHFEAARGAPGMPDSGAVVFRLAAAGAGARPRTAEARAEPAAPFLLPPSHAGVAGPTLPPCESQIPIAPRPVAAALPQACRGAQTSPVETAPPLVRRPSLAAAVIPTVLPEPAAEPVPEVPADSREELVPEAASSLLSLRVENMMPRDWGGSHQADLTALVPWLAPLLPACRLRPFAVAVRVPAQRTEEYAQRRRPWTTPLRLWESAPVKLKWGLMCVPLLLALSFRFSGPSASAATQPKARMGDLLATRWDTFQENLLSRATISLADDFRSGLSEWEGAGDWARSWSYDSAGFVRPGGLAVFRPSMPLADYRLEFLGLIERRSLAWAFRATDLKNYYAVKLTVVKPGPLPTVVIERYAVIGGKPGRPSQVPLAVQVHNDTVYRVQVDVRGQDFTISVQGRVVDSFSDDRLSSGGVGFFCDKGEAARLRWVGITHQYDFLGRLCALLAPYDGEKKQRSMNP